MKKIMLVLVFVAAVGLVMGSVMAGVAKAEPQTKCPVMGLKIDEKVYTDYQGKRIYFCCSDCLGKFKADPKKYMKKMEAEGVTPSNTPAK